MLKFIYKFSPFPRKLFLLVSVFGLQSYKKRCILDCFFISFLHFITIFVTTVPCFLIGQKSPKIFQVRFLKIFVIEKRPSIRTNSPVEDGDFAILLQSNKFIDRQL